MRESTNHQNQFTKDTELEVPLHYIFVDKQRFLIKNKANKTDRKNIKSENPTNMKRKSHRITSVDKE